MKLGTIKRISKEDMARKGQVPTWVDPMLDTLNEFIEKITQAVSGNLTFADNFLAKTHYQSFTHNVAQIVNPNIEGRTQLTVDGVIPIDTNGVTVTGFKWSRLDTGNIEVTFSFSSSVTTKCKILIIMR